MQQRFARECFRPLLSADRVRVLNHFARALLQVGRIHRHAGVIALGIKDVKVDSEVWIAFAVEQAFLNRVRLDPFAGIETGILRVHAASHIFDNQKRTKVVEIRFAAAGGTGRTGFSIDVEAGAQDR